MNRVLFITQSITPEFSRHSLLIFLARNLKKKDLEFRFIEYNPTEKIDNIKQKKINDYNLFIYSSRLKSFAQIILEVSSLKSNDILLIGGYGHLECWITLLIANLKDLKIVGWLGASSKSTINNTFFHKILKKFFISKLSSIVTYGKLSTQFYEDLGFPREKIFTGLNSSDTSFFKFLVNDNLIIEKGKKVKCVWAGKFIPRKGLLELLDEIISDKYILSTIDLKITGFGPLELEIVKKIKPYENISFVGKSDEFALRKIFQEGSLFLHSTWADPFSRILSEASSAGLFIISSIYDDSTEVLYDGINFVKYNPKIQGSFKKAFLKAVKICKENSYTKRKLSEICPFSYRYYSEKIFQAITNV